MQHHFGLPFALQSNFQAFESRVNFCFFFVLLFFGSGSGVHRDMYIERDVYYKSK